MDLKTMIQEWEQALHYEVQALKEQRSGGIRLMNGECLYHEGKGTVYAFTGLWDMQIPEGVPVTIVLADQEVKGTVLDCFRKEITIAFERFVGEEVEEAELFSEPWELLQKLAERLEEAGEKSVCLRRMKRLLSPPETIRHPADQVKNTLHEAALRAQYNPVTYIWGPPGTGKTYTLARVAGRHYVNRRKVLILSHSHAAVDVLLKEVREFLEGRQRWKRGEIIRYGSAGQQQMMELHDMIPQQLVKNDYPQVYERYAEEKARADVRERSESRTDKRQRAASQEWEDLCRQTAERAVVIGTTLAKAAVDPFIYKREFDLVIVDEASMAFLPQLAFAASLGEHAVICGDFRQLPPIVLSRHAIAQKWLKTDVFHHSGIAAAAMTEQGHSQLLMLNIQRRMHPDISAFTNKVFYGGKVADGAAVQTEREITASKAPFRGQAAICVNIADSWPAVLKEENSASKFNLTSLFIALQLITEARAEGVQSIGFIAPYRAQTQLMNACLAELFSKEWSSGAYSAATVHKFQGAEREMILFDAVDAPPQLVPGRLLTGEDSARLINVAMTRAKGKFILLSDDGFISKTMAASQPLRQLMHYLKGKGQMVEYGEAIRDCSAVHPHLAHQQEERMSRCLKDLIKAKHSIVVGLPPKSKPPKAFWQAIQRAQHKCSIKILCKFKKVPFSNVELVAAALPFPFILIDEKIFWLGAPLYREGSVQFRLSSVPFARHFSQMFNTANNRAEIQQWVKQQKSPRAAFANGRAFTDFIACFDRCPVCANRRDVRVTKNRFVRLECPVCQAGEFPSKPMLQSYLDHTGAECAACRVRLKADWSGKAIVAVCPRCANVVDLHTFI
ncbi:DEAD/DEAH box helicase [Bacillus xiapuensis]|uniref:DEAD/DEAH box helicase n=1 Tax=Bacillus xiapuensis TaxID=2014075 RepID=UPI000C239148|nr:AAA domain-containing protein [Bacillus xiapuensis]